MLIGDCEIAFVMLKPDALRRRLAAPILYRLCAPEMRVYHVLQSAPIRATYAQMVRHYDKDDAWKIKFGDKKKQVLAEEERASRSVECMDTEDLLESDARLEAIAALDPLVLGDGILEQVYAGMMDGRLIPIIMIGEPGLNDRLKELVGPTDPAESRKKGLSTIRAMSDDDMATADKQNRSVRNLIHLADTDRVAKEIANMLPKLATIVPLLSSTPQ